MCSVLSLFRHYVLLPQSVFCPPCLCSSWGTSSQYWMNPVFYSQSLHAKIKKHKCWWTNHIAYKLTSFSSLTYSSLFRMFMCWVFPVSCSDFQVVLLKLPVPSIPYVQFRSQKYVAGVASESLQQNFFFGHLLYSIFPHAKRSFLPNSEWYLYLHSGSHSILCKSLCSTIIPLSILPVPISMQAWCSCNLS